MKQVKNETIIYNAAVYCRLSKDDDQTGESVSIETQKIMLMDFCQERGFNVHEIYVDDGYSGLNFNRPSFTRLLGDIESGKVNLVITKDLSRLGRDYIQTGYYIDIYFNQKQVRYIAINDGIDTINDNNDIAPFKNILNDMYARDLSRKVKSAKRLRAQKGYYISAQAPFGYMVDPLNHNHLVVDEYPATVVKEIFKLAIQGYTLIQISRILTEKEIVTPGVYKAQKGDKRFLRYQDRDNASFNWCYQTVRAILRNQVYTGDMVNHKCEIINYKTKKRIRVPNEKQIVVPDRHEAIVNRDDYERVQSLISLRHRPPKYHFENAFRDLTFCAECSHRMTLMMKPLKAGPKPLIRCTNHYNHPDQCTHNNYIYYDDLYAEVLRRVQTIAGQIERGELPDRLQEQNVKRKYEEKLISEHTKSYKRSVAIRRIIQKLYEDYGADILDSNSYHSMLLVYTREQNQIATKLAKIESELRRTRNDDLNIQKLKDTIDRCLDLNKLTAESLNQFIERIEIDHTFYNDERKYQDITIVYRFIGIIDDN